MSGHNSDISKKALICGITGQDGSYLTEFLLAKGYSRNHALGWKARISIEDGMASTYQWYCTHAAASVAG